MNLTSLGL